MSNRARVIYQSEALYAGTVDATGYHFLTGASASDGVETDGSSVTRTGIEQLHRVQSANYSFSLNRQDVNQFGQLARIDSVVLEPPTVTLDFSYYLTNGFNEKTLGFNIDGNNGENSTWNQALTEDIILGKTSYGKNPVGKNFFILTSAEGTDAVNNTTVTTVKAQDEIPEVPATPDSLTHDGVTYTAVAPGADSGITITISDTAIEDGIAAVGNDITVSLTGGVSTRTQGDILTAFDSAPTEVTSLITITAADPTVNLTTQISSVALDGGSNLIPAVPAVLEDTTRDDINSTIALGNGFVSNYSIEAAVGGMPTANVTIDGLNLRSYTGTANLDNPAIDISYGIPLTGTNKFSLPVAVSGKDDRGADGAWGGTDDTTGDAGIACLRPGDITLSLGNLGRASEFELLPHSDAPEDYDDRSAHIQSFSIDVPISRSTINRLGNPWGYARTTDFPINISVSVNAIVSELKAGNVADHLFNDETHELIFTMREPNATGLGEKALEFKVKGARLEGESFSSSIGSNKTVDITFTAQVGGPNDSDNGLFISGSHSNEN